jgi:hypothetical protein
MGIQKGWDAMGSGISTNLRLTLLVTVAGVICFLVLPGFPVSRAATAARGARQDVSRSGLDRSRQSALEKLYANFRAGGQFSEEEGALLRKFSEGVQLSELEADVLISRALNDYYVAGNELTKEQEDLLGRYEHFVARRDHDIADRKSQSLNKRIAAAAAAPPRNTPLAPPANDLCAGAEIIPAAGPFPYLTAVTSDITDATVTGDPPGPSCQIGLSRSIWYTFTPATTADYTISSCTGAPTATTVDDTVMAIYTTTGGCGGALTELPTGGTTDGCDDDSCSGESFQAVIETRLNAGTQYFVVIWEFGAAPPIAGHTAVQLRVTRVLGSANDICATAAPLSLDTPVNGTTVAAGADYSLSGTTCFTGIGNSSSTAAGRDVVYSFTAPAAGNYSFRVTNFNTLSNVILYVSTSCPPPGILTCNSLGGPVIAAANRDSPGSVNSSEEVKCLSLTTGQQVFVFVDENSVTDGSSFTIEVNSCTQETEPNDTPAQADPIVLGIEGSINPAGDADFYTLGTPAAGSRVFAMVDGIAANAKGDFDLRVTTATDTLEYDDSNNDAPFRVLAPNVAGTPTTGTQTFLRVNHFSANPVPPIAPPPTPEAAEPYRLYAIVQPPINTATVEAEPNNTIAQANAAANNYFSGNLGGPAPSIDEDVFVFTAQAGTLIFLSLDCDPLRDNTPMNGALELLDGAGATLLSVNDGGSTSSTTASPGTLVATTPAAPSEALVFRISVTGTYYARVSIGTTLPGSTGAGDYLLSIGNAMPASSGNDTIGLFRPAGNLFFLRNSNTTGFPDVTVAFGAPGDLPIVGDWDGDGTTTIGLYRPSTSTFFLRNSNTAGFPDVIVSFGDGPGGDLPIVGDWDGDGDWTIGVYRPSTSTFYLRNTNTVGFPDLSIPFGAPGDMPIVGDWDGDGTTTIGLFRPSGNFFFLRNSNSVGFPDATVPFGAAGDLPLVGDWDGNGTTTIGLFRSSGNLFFLRNSNTVGFPDITVSFGAAGDKPLSGNWDGN